MRYRNTRLARRTLRLWAALWSVPALFALACDSGDSVDQPNYADASGDHSTDERHEAGDADAGDRGDERDALSEVDTDADVSTEAEAEAEAGEADVDGGSDADALVPGVCGDGVLNLGETCDDGFRDTCGACNVDCSGPGDGRQHFLCGCALADGGATDAASPTDGGTDAGLPGVGEDFTTDMVGCPGTASFDDRAGLCAAGYAPCTVDQWVARRKGLVPHHHYWTNESLNYVYESRDGVHDSCYYSKTYGGACATATHVCADRDVDPEGNRCSETPNEFPRNCGRFDPPPIANDYFGGYYGDFTAGTLCCCDAVPDSGHGCGPASGLGDVFSNGMFGCSASKSWQDRASICAPGCKVCTAQDWIDRRQGQAPKHNYWTDDNLKASGWGDGECNVSKLYGTNGSPYPMRVCSAHMDSEGNTCVWIGCGMADIAPPPNEYLGGCSDIRAGTICCKQ